MLTSFFRILVQNGDAVLPILAERSARLVDSLLAVQALETLEAEDVEAVHAHL